MYGRGTAVCGQRRGYLLTDDISVSHVAGVLLASPKKVSKRLGDHNVAIVNRSPHLMRADAAGKQAYLVLTVLHGVEQAVLVTATDGNGRKMTCVPVRFDADLYHAGVVFSGVLTASGKLILEDVLRVGQAHISSVGAIDRANILYHFVHEKHRADPFVQPFVVKCARFMATDICHNIGIWKEYEDPIRSVTLCSIKPGYPDMWHQVSKSQRRPTPIGPLPTFGKGRVRIVAQDAPDVYQVLDAPQGNLVVKSLADSRKLKKLTEGKPPGTEFVVDASWDANVNKWTYSNVDNNV